MDQGELAPLFVGNNHYVLVDLLGMALSDWLHAEWPNSSISSVGIDWNEQEQRYIFGSKTLAWINLQLAKE